MVTVLLRGGLGNQMFQYAAGLAVARKKKVPLVLDTTFLNDRFPRKQFTYRTYDLHVFDLAPRFTALSKISTALPVPGVWLGIDLALVKIKEVLGMQRLIPEGGKKNFDREVARADGEVALWGFWQSEEYFKEIKDEVAQAFRFREPLRGEAVRIGEKIRRTASVSLHVRRKDYLLPKYQKVYGATDLSYYERAARYIGERVSNPTFFVFSDDVAWCREYIRPPFPTIYLDDATAGPKASYHLQLMASCEHNIITNSSFSWWGAWLNGNAKKIVIAPQVWDAARRDYDRVPGAWIRL